MMILILFGLIFSVGIIVILKDGIKYPIFVLGISFLIFQTAYLFQVAFDNAPESEEWMILALTYIPLSVILFLILSLLCVIKVRKEKIGLDRFKSLLIIPIHGVGSYCILLIWAHVFQFPL